MAKRTPKKLHSFRLDPDLVKWVASYAKAVRSDRTKVLEALFNALRNGRLWVEPDNRPNPFPGVTRPEILPVKPYDGIHPGTYPHRDQEEDS